LTRVKFPRSELHQNAHMTDRNGAKRCDPTRPRGQARRTRAGGVLLFAWALFAIVGIVQPCCMAQSGSTQDSQVQSHTDCEMTTPQSDTFSGGAAGGSGGGSGQCPLAFSESAAVTGDFPPLPAKAEIVLHVAASDVSEPFSAVSGSSGLLLRYHAPPQRIYLRTQRFLS
jgi:hypothetical protein